MDIIHQNDICLRYTDGYPDCESIFNDLQNINTRVSNQEISNTIYHISGNDFLIVENVSIRGEHNTILVKRIRVLDGTKPTVYRDGENIQVLASAILNIGAFRVLKSLNGDSYNAQAIKATLVNDLGNGTFAITLVQNVYHLSSIEPWKGGEDAWDGIAIPVKASKTGTKYCTVHITMNPFQKPGVKKVNVLIDDPGVKAQCIGNGNRDDMERWSGRYVGINSGQLFIAKHAKNITHSTHNIFPFVLQDGKHICTMTMYMNDNVSDRSKWGTALFHSGKYNVETCTMDNVNFYSHEFSSETVDEIYGGTQIGLSGKASAPLTGEARIDSIESNKIYGITSVWGNPNNPDEGYPVWMYKNAYGSFPIDTFFKMPKGEETSDTDDHWWKNLYTSSNDVAPTYLSLLPIDGNVNSTQKMISISFDSSMKIIHHNVREFGPFEMPLGYHQMYWFRPMKFGWASIAVYNKNQLRYISTNTDPNFDPLMYSLRESNGAKATKRMVGQFWNLENLLSTAMGGYNTNSAFDECESIAVIKRFNADGYESGVWYTPIPAKSPSYSGSHPTIKIVKTDDDIVAISFNSRTGSECMKIVDFKSDLYNPDTNPTGHQVTHPVIFPDHTKLYGNYGTGYVNPSPIILDGGGQDLTIYDAATPGKNAVQAFELYTPSSELNGVNFHAQVANSILIEEPFLVMERTNANGKLNYFLDDKFNINVKLPVAIQNNGNTQEINFNTFNAASLNDLIKYHDIFHYKQPVPQIWSSDPGYKMSKEVAKMRTLESQLKILELKSKSKSTGVDIFLSISDVMVDSPRPIGVPQMLIDKDKIIFSWMLATSSTANGEASRWKDAQGNVIPYADVDLNNVWITHSVPWNMSESVYYMQPRMSPFISTGCNVGGTTENSISLTNDGRIASLFRYWTVPSAVLSTFSLTPLGEYKRYYEEVPVEAP